MKGVSLLYKEGVMKRDLDYVENGREMGTNVITFGLMTGTTP